MSGLFYPLYIILRVAAMSGSLADQDSDIAQTSPRLPALTSYSSLGHAWCIEHASRLSIHFHAVQEYNGSQAAREHAHGISCQWRVADVYRLACSAGLDRARNPLERPAIVRSIFLLLLALFYHK